MASNFSFFNDLCSRFRQHFEGQKSIPEGPTSNCKSQITRLKGLGEEELIENFSKVVSTFPPSVVERGINRNWNLYLFLLETLAPFWGLVPRNAKVCDIGSGAAILPLTMAKVGFRVSLIDRWSEYASQFDNQMGNTDDFFSRFKKFGASYYTCELLSETIPLPDQKQNLDRAIYVLEHIPRPPMLL